MASVWIGDLYLEGAIRSGSIVLEGPSYLRRAFPGWLKLNLFASIERPAARVAACEVGSIALGYRWDAIGERVLRNLNDTFTSLSPPLIYSVDSLHG